VVLTLFKFYDEHCLTFEPAINNEITLVHDFLLLMGNVFVCAYAECLSRGVSAFDFKQDDMLAYRMKIGLSLLGNEHFDRFFGDGDNGI
jgi:hypothetical protein